MHFFAPCSCSIIMILQTFATFSVIKSTPSGGDSTLPKKRKAEAEPEKPVKKMKMDLDTTAEEKVPTSKDTSQFCLIWLLCVHYEGAAVFIFSYLNWVTLLYTKDSLYNILCYMTKSDLTLLGKWVTKQINFLKRKKCNCN